MGSEHVWFGFCANITALYILRKKQHDNSTNFYSLMLLLSIFDLAYICMSLLTFSLNKFSMSYQEHAWGYIVPWSIPILQISLTGSIYCTMAITLERYFVICIWQEIWAVVDFVTCLEKCSIVCTYFHISKYFLDWKKLLRMCKRWY